MLVSTIQVPNVADVLTTEHQLSLTPLAYTYTHIYTCIVQIGTNKLSLITDVVPMHPRDGEFLKRLPNLEFGGARDYT